MAPDDDLPYDHGHDFSEDDEGKSVVTADGRQIGTVESVTNGDPKFRHDPEMPGPLKESLGVSDGPTSTLQHEHISSVTDDEVQLHDPV